MLVKICIYFLFYISSMMLHWERRHANWKRRREKRSSTKGAAECISNLPNLFILQKLHQFRKRTYWQCVQGFVLLKRCRTERKKRHSYSHNNCSKKSSCFLRKIRKEASFLMFHRTIRNVVSLRFCTNT